MKCLFCGHPMQDHVPYYGGWCAVDVTVIEDGIPPYSLSCWCDGTSEGRGPRMVIREGSTLLERVDDRYWRIPA